MEKMRAKGTTLRDCGGIMMDVGENSVNPTQLGLGRDGGNRTGWDCVVEDTWTVEDMVPGEETVV